MSGQKLVLLLLVIFVVAVSAQRPPGPPRPWWCVWWPALCPRPPPRCCPTGGIWSTWKEKTPCSDSCGSFGTQTLQRTCLNEPRCGGCTGPSEKPVSCNPTPCQFPRNSCKDGMKATAVGKQILCVDPAVPAAAEVVPKASCCPRGGIMEITDWTSCNTARCGSCDTQSRQKKCRTKDYGCGECSEAEQTETRPCITTPCKYPQKSCCDGSSAKTVNNQIVCAASG
ncbi:hypothetical protein M3Y97_00606400 [Aphelenchoides bicaudatus]|nr:hypothetical protein M3Y97_00606400 [Aphelenchoides bicaudatus]